MCDYEACCGECSQCEARWAREDAQELEDKRSFDAWTRMFYGVLLLAALIHFAGCAHTTPKGLQFDDAQASSVNVDKINPAQIDAAWDMATAALGAVPANDVLILFWDLPINGQYSGATWNTQINVYLKPGDESCLFLDGNEGTLLHEMGHAILWLQSGDADPSHKRDAVWHVLEEFRGELKTEMCHD